MPLLALAEKWGIGDDYEREIAVTNASVEDLQMLIRCVDNIQDEDLYGWLGGSESYNETPSPEYIAIACLTMAIDSARVELAKRQSKKRA